MTTKGQKMTLNEDKKDLDNTQHVEDLDIGVRNPKVN